MEEKIEKYIDNKFKSIGLVRGGGWADGLGCDDIEDIIRDAIKFGMNFPKDSNELWSIPIVVIPEQMSIEQIDDGLKKGDPSIMAFVRRYGTKLT